MKMYFLFKIGIFHCYVCLPEGIIWETCGKTECLNDLLETQAQISFEDFSNIAIEIGKEGMFFLAARYLG